MYFLSHKRKAEIMLLERKAYALLLEGLINDNILSLEICTVAREKCVFIVARDKS